MADIAVVILNWNGKKLLQEFLPSVLQFSQGHKIYVIDNGSEDASLAFLKNNFPTVTAIPLSENKGYAGGYNDGLQQVEADVYCLLNSDVKVTDGWLRPFTKHFSRHPEGAIAQPHIMDLKKPNHFEYAGAAGGYIDQLGYPFCRGRVFNSLEKGEGQYGDDVPIFWASGACFFIRSKVFWKLNGFDEDFFSHQEEIDLCWRAKSRGYKIMSLSSSKIYHLGGATLPQTFRKVYLNHRNSLFMLLKNLPAGKVFKTLTIRFFWEGLTFFYYLIKLKPLFSVAILYAHFSFWKNFLKMWRKRSKVHFYNYYATRNILLQYYFFFKRKFTNLNIVKN